MAESVSYFFERDGVYNITAYVVDDPFTGTGIFLGKPLVAFSRVLEMFKPEDFSVFVALGYQNMNKLRKGKFEYFKEKGYSLANYISPFVKGNFSLGENSIIMDGAMIQPCAKFGNNVFVWGGAMVGHHAVIEDHCWLTGGCQIGGSAKIGKETFIGIGALVGHEVIIGARCMVGAGTLTCKNIPDGTVLIAPNTEAHRLNSEQFTRMSTCFRI